MTEGNAGTDRTPDPARPWIAALLLFGIGLCLALQLHLVFVQEINWDEYFFLSHVHAFDRGTLARALQSFHVHLFGWLPAVPGGEIAQIEAARLAMLACEAGTMACIYAVGRRFLDREEALAAVLAYIAAGVVMLHGASFRADPIATVLMMLCCALLARSTLRAPALALLAVAGALAMLITVKAIFYAPLIAALAAWRLWRAAQPRALALRLAVTGVAAGAVFAGLYLWHQSLMSADLDGSRALLANAYEKTILEAGLFPRADVLLSVVLNSPVQAALAVTGVGMAGAALVRRSAYERPLMLLALATPLLTLIFYRNAFPYFFAFILPPVAVVAGYATERLGRRWLIPLALAMTIGSVVSHSRGLAKPQDAQAELIAAVHAVFPEPVPYIDRCSMIARFPKTGFFMSSWGVESYRAADREVFRAIARDRAPPLLIANGPALEAAMAGADSADGNRLLPGDAAFLRDNYVHHWGAIWVAGKTLRLVGGKADFEIVIGGRYTVEADAPVTIDGRRYTPKTVVALAPGFHGIAGGVDRAVLRWGDNLHVPTAKPSTEPLFRGF
ncbi:glycosyltransferase family 39 protein [Sphingomonas gilva]|nr:glycosyltransferase family 39 protein [Sphingomonas gilva]